MTSQVERGAKRQNRFGPPYASDILAWENNLWTTFLT
jgi:hypothetical protein